MFESRLMPLAVVLLFTAFPGVADDRLLIAASNLKHPPFSSKDATGKVVGIEAEIVERAARTLGARVQWVERPFAELLIAIEEGSVDIAVSTIGITEERKRRVAFSDAYHETQIVALVRDGDSTPSSLTELAEARIGAAESTTAHSAAARQWPAATLIGTVQDGLTWPQMVARGAIDAFVVDASDQARLEAVDGVSLVRIEEPLRAEYFGVAMAPEEEELLAAVNRAIAERDIDPARNLLARSLEHHDPGNVWSQETVEIVARVRLAERLASERGYAERFDRVRMNQPTGEFYLHSDRGEVIVELFGSGESFYAKLNGSREISPADREAHGLVVDRMPRWRNYFTYMFGIPMKLNDPGTRIDPEVQRVEFAGREVLSLRVTYEPEVGGDIWYFYFDPETSALAGCRFYHDEAANDGEFIVFEGETQGPRGLRLPQRRLWHMNRDGEYIAVDEIVSID